MSQTQKNFVKGAAILGIAGIIVKIIGAFFRIPLTNIIGSEGIGYYQMAYPIYSMLLVISTAGLPTAISKLVAEHVAQDNFADAHYTFQVAWRVLLVLGIATSGVMIFLAQPISQLQQSPPAAYSLLAISPALFFVALISAYRGYFQGLQYMVPTAVSQLLEQVFKLIAGLFLADFLYKLTDKVEFGAMGAVIGVSISEIVAMLYIMITYKRRKGNIISRIRNLDPQGASKRFKKIFKQIIIIAVPVTLGACVMPIVNAIDSFIVPTSLQKIGNTQEVSASLYGMLTGVVNPLINMPAVLSLALAMSLVPAISQSQAQDDARSVAEKSSFGFKLALLVGLPCAIGLFLLAEPVITLLYRSLKPGEVEIAVPLLQLAASEILFLTMIQTMTGILQGFGKPVLPVISLAVGAVVKIALSIVLIGDPDINIYGAVLGTIACYAIAAVMDVAFVVINTNFKLSIANHILKPVLASVALGIVVWLVYRAIGNISNTLGVTAAIIAGLLIYLIVLMLTKGLTPEELKMVPGGDKIKRLMIKLRIWN